MGEERTEYQNISVQYFNIYQSNIEDRRYYKITISNGNDYIYFV